MVFKTLPRKKVLFYTLVPKALAFYEARRVYFPVQICASLHYNDDVNIRYYFRLDMEVFSVYIMLHGTVLLL